MTFKYVLYTVEVFIYWVNLYWNVMFLYPEYEKHIVKYKYHIEPEPIQNKFYNAMVIAFKSL